MEDYAASAQTLAGGISLSQVIQGFTASIDTLAWVILLYLFELETYILDDEKIVGWVKWTMHGIRGVCYIFILYSFYGYLLRYSLFRSIEPFEIENLCNLIGSNYTFAVDMDEYVPWTSEICQSVKGISMLQIIDTNVLTTPSQLVEIHRLSIAETINSGGWILVVFILELEVWLQLKGKLTPHIVKYSKYLKITLYSILTLIALYWGVKGDFLDFGDAFLWLVGFFFIELNIFDWNAETNQANKEKLTS